MRVLITGANGFLGRHVVAEFLRRGHAVRALVRPAARLDDLGWPEPVEVVRADLRVSRELAAAFAGVDVLVHLAAAVTGGEDAQLAATVVGTERLLDAMARSQTGRLVLASSFSVYDWGAIATGGTLCAVSLYALGRVRPPAPALEVWSSGEAPAWYSPPLLDRIRDSSRATVLTEPLACDAGGRYGGPRDGDGTATVADGRAGAVT